MADKIRTCKVRSLMIKYEELGLYSQGSFTGELQTHTSQFLTDLKKDTFTTDPGVEITYHAITTNERPFFFLEKRHSFRLFMAVTNYGSITIGSHRCSKKLEKTGAVLGKLSHGRTSYRKLPRQCLNL